MLLEEVVAEPVGQVFLLAAGLAQQFMQLRRRPRVAVGGREQLLDAVRCTRLARDGWEADNAIIVCQGIELIGLGLSGPMIAEESGDRDVQESSRHLRLPVEQPLGGVF